MSGRRRVITVCAVVLATAGLTAGATSAHPPDRQAGVLNPPLHCGDSSTGLDSYPERGITLPHVPLPAAEVHPSVDFTAADVPTLRARAGGMAPDPHGLYARDWGKLASDVASGATGGKSADDIASRRAKASAFTYVVTGDPADRATAIGALTHAFDTIEDDDLDIAAQVTTYSQAYDYLADSIPRASADDVTIRAAIKRGAQWLADWLDHDNPAGSNPRPHNHRSKAALGLGLWSLVFAADPAASGWLATAQEQLDSTYEFMFTRDGVYLDGYGYYWDYQLFQLVPFLYAVRHLTGVDLFTPMRPAFEWMVRDSTPQGHLPNIEDGWLKLTWTAIIAPAYRNTRTSLSTAPLSDVLQWRFFAQDWAAVQYPDLGLGVLRVQRRVLFSPSGCTLILDELAAETPRTWTWLLHTDRSAEPLADGRLLVRSGTGALLIHPLTGGRISRGTTPVVANPTASTPDLTVGRELHTLRIEHGPAATASIGTLLVPGSALAPVPATGVTTTGDSVSWRHGEWVEQVHVDGVEVMAIARHRTGTERRLRLPG